MLLRELSLMTDGRTDCASAAPPLIDRADIVAETGTQNRPDLARREAASVASACWAANLAKQLLFCGDSSHFNVVSDVDKFDTVLVRELCMRPAELATVYRCCVSQELEWLADRRSDPVA